MPILSYIPEVDNEKNNKCKKYTKLGWSIRYKSASKFSKLSSRFYLQIINKEPRGENEYRSSFIASSNNKILRLRLRRNSKFTEEKELIQYYNSSVRTL